MKSYIVTVNGVAYNVTVEETAALPAQSASIPPTPAAAPQPAPIPVAAAPAQQPAPVPPQPATAAPPQNPEKGTPIESPLPGVLIDFKVKAGDTVQQNSVVAIIEAMKMENEVVSPYSGTVASLVASKGATLNSGDVILTIIQ